MRVFFAFPLPGQFDNDVAWQLSHAVFPRGLEWVNPLNYHITICFLGEVADDQLDALIARAEKLVESIQPFEIETQVLTHFPPKEPNMLWVKFQHSTLFENVYNTFHQAFGIPVRFQGAKAHVTLARFPRRRHITYRRPWHGYKLHLDHLHLYRSVGSFNSLHYESLHSFQLSGTSDASN
jgi:2'-5' RNA ligase